jgi:hypothetical protein
MCRVAEVNPTDWLQYVLGHIQDYSINKIHELLPHNWKNMMATKKSEVLET